MSYYINLRLFDGEGEGTTGENTTADAEQIQENTPTADDRFEELIKGEYKDAFAKRTQKIINSRFKETKDLENKLKSQQEIFDMVSSKYGVSDIGDLKAAIEADDSYYEDEALERGLTVEQLKGIKKMERENAELRRSVEERQRQEEARATYQRWYDQGEQLKSVYPSFDFQTELQNEDFVGLIKNGIDVKTAFEVIHKDDILGGAMQYAANKAVQNVGAKIRSRASVPQANGATSGSSIASKKTVDSMTRAERDDIERRALRGERITL